jgi:hypothetical protein
VGRLGEVCYFDMNSVRSLALQSSEEIGFVLLHVPALLFCLVPPSLHFQLS